MDPKDHSAITHKWQEEWQDFFDEFDRKNKKPTRKDVERKLFELYTDEQFYKDYKKGAQADLSHQQWSALDPNAKMSKFKRLAKAMGTLLGALAVVGAAESAKAAFEPLFALGDERAQRDFRNALEALKQERYDVADRALFGEGQEADIFQKNPKGLIPKLLSAQHEANPFQRDALLLLYRGARKKYNQLVDEARYGRFRM